MKTNKLKTLAIGLLASTAFWVASALQAQVPMTMQYSGKISTDNGNYDGTGYFKFAFASEDGSEIYWTNTGDAGAVPPASAMEVEVSDGVYSVLLGSGDNPVDSTVLGQESAVYLHVWFSETSDGTFSAFDPVMLTSVPYALVSSSASTAAMADTATTADTALAVSTGVEGEDPVVIADLIARLEAVESGSTNSLPQLRSNRQTDFILAAGSTIGDGDTIDLSAHFDAFYTGIEVTNNTLPSGLSIDINGRNNQGYIADVEIAGDIASSESMDGEQVTLTLTNENGVTEHVFTFTVGFFRFFPIDTDDADDDGDINEATMITQYDNNDVNHNGNDGAIHDGDTFNIEIAAQNDSVLDGEVSYDWVGDETDLADLNTNTTSKSTTLGPVTITGGESFGSAQITVNARFDPGTIELDDFNEDILDMDFDLEGAVDIIQTTQIDVIRGFFIQNLDPARGTGDRDLDDFVGGDGILDLEDNDGEPLTYAIVGGNDVRPQVNIDFDNGYNQTVEVNWYQVVGDDDDPDTLVQTTSHTDDGNSQPSFSGYIDTEVNGNSVYEFYPIADSGFATHAFDPNDGDEHIVITVAEDFVIFEAPEVGAPIGGLQGTNSNDAADANYLATDGHTLTIAYGDVLDAPGYVDPAPNAVEVTWYRYGLDEDLDDASAIDADSEDFINSFFSQFGADLQFNNFDIMDSGNYYAVVESDYGIERTEIVEIAIASDFFISSDLDDDNPINATLGDQVELGVEVDLRELVGQTMDATVTDIDGDSAADDTRLTGEEEDRITVQWYQVVGDPDSEDVDGDAADTALGAGFTMETNVFLVDGADAEAAVGNYLNTVDIGGFDEGDLNRNRFKVSLEFQALNSRRGSYYAIVSTARGGSLQSEVQQVLVNNP